MSRKTEDRRQQKENSKKKTERKEDVR